jgi:hypothetical protein
VFWKPNNISGFTATELQIHEALAGLDTRPDHELLKLNLDTVVIHPMFDKGKWEKPLGKHLAKYPLGNGRQGFWDVSQ